MWSNGVLNVYEHSEVHTNTQIQIRKYTNMHLPKQGVLRKRWSNGVSVEGERFQTRILILPPLIFMLKVKSAFSTHGNF